MKPRPMTTIGGQHTATPEDAGMIDLLGAGGTIEGVAFTHDQIRAMQRLYSYDFAQVAKEHHNAAEEGYQKALADYAKRKPREPYLRPPTNESRDVGRFAAQGSARNMYRHAASDGYRMVAAIARHLAPGDDPVRALCQLMIDAGWDVPVDPDWLEEE